ncbi:major capsid protein [Vibrio hepatarius]|uniref:major capsid protein n=1 Tax=Vibrio hepatarius TaxID=171383 RepID=UPI00148BBEE8|nr:major capsid protein [Vibrio hepatarius]
MYSPVATAVLIALHQTLPPQYEPALKKFYVKGIVTFNTSEVLFDKIKKGRKLAPLVSPMVSGKPQRAKSAVQQSITPAYVKPTDAVTSDRLMKRMPGERPLGDLTPTQRREAIISDMLMEFDASIERREEWMLVQMLTTGRVVLEGPAFEAVEIDYGRSAKNQVTLIGADCWDRLDKDTSTKPLEDIEAWADNCNSLADHVAMSKSNWSLLKQFKCVKDIMDTRRGSKSNGELGPLNNQAFKWVATVGEYEIYVSNGTYENDAGVDTKYFPDNGVLVGSSAAEIYMAYGGIQDVKANAQGIVETERYPSNWFQDNPSVEMLQMQSAPVPVMFDADDFCFAAVR